jgi:hypothetical protein
MSRPIKQLTGKGKFTTESVRKLVSLGYTTIEEVGSAASVSSEAANNFLGFNVGNAIEALSPTPVLYEMLGAEAKKLPPFSLGVLLDKIPAPPAELKLKTEAFAFAAVPPVLPASVSLIPQCPPIRDQQNRGTCVAFSTLSAYEKKTEDFSEQFIYALCKQRDGSPNTSGTWLAVAFPIVRDVGVCRENTWPYVGNPIPGNEGQNPPPPAASAAAPQFKRSFLQLSPTGVTAIKTALAAGKVVSFSIPVFNSWYQNPQVRLSGNIVMPFPNEPIAGGHAMAFVGYADDAAAPGGGRFLIRNSWDSYWATQSTTGVGYGTIPYAYIANFGKEAYHFV